MLAGCVDASCWNHHKSVDRSCVYYRSALSLSDHLFQLGLKQEEQGLDIHGKSAVEVFFCLIHEQSLLTGCSCVIECVIEPSKRLQSVGHDESNLFGIIQVGPQERRATAEALDFADQPSSFEVPPPDDDHLCAQARKTTRGCSADTASPSGDEGDLSGKFRPIFGSSSRCLFRELRWTTSLRALLVGCRYVFDVCAHVATSRTTPPLLSARG